MRQGELFAEQLDGARDWTLKLIADLNGDDWGFQPQPGLAHPLFLCGHLAAAENLLVHVRCLKSSVLDDAFTKCFPIGGPIKALREFDYPSIEHVLATMRTVHHQTLEAIRGMSDELLAEPAFAADGKSAHPHYRDKRGAVTHCARHEAFHAGQIAMIRRLLGKTFLR